MVDGPVCKYSALYVWHLDDVSCQHFAIREIVIPVSVRYIDKSAFYRCSMLDKKWM